MMGYELHGLGGSIVMILLWTLPVLGAIALVKYIANNSPDQRSEPRSAIEILEERYAKGEIDKQEFESKKKDLSK